METLRILVCEGDHNLRQAIASTLSEFVAFTKENDGEVRFAVKQANSAEAALELIDQETPDLLLLDLEQPDSSGKSLLSTLAPRKLDMLIIAMSAYASIDLAVRAMRHGAFDFLVKPMSHEDLKDTIRKAAEHWIMVRQARQLAQDRRRVRFEFISVLAHELKAPINAVEGYLNLIGSGVLEADSDATAKVIAQSKHRLAAMRKLIGDLLDMTRIESGDRKRTLQVCDLRKIARSIIEGQRPVAAEANIGITLHADAPVCMVADNLEIEMIFSNLVSNAVKYNSPGGRVDVYLDVVSGGIEIRVADTGIGMSKEEAAKVFHDFVRIKNERTRGILGSGLGLSIIKKIVSQYGGQITVSSSPGLGTTFTVLLSARVPDAPPSLA